MDSPDDAAARRCLMTAPPWSGKSDFDARCALKAAGAKWDPHSRQWEARDASALVRMLKTGAWLPLGCSHAVARRVVAIGEAEERAAEAQRQQAERLEAKRKVQQQADRRKLQRQAKEQAKQHSVPRKLQIVSYFVSCSTTATKEPQHQDETDGQGAQTQGVKRGTLKIEQPEAPAPETATQACPAVTCSSTTSTGTGSSTSTPSNAAAARVVRGSGPRECSRVGEKAYTLLCDACGAKVDSRLQFGLECECGFWSRCDCCFIPLWRGSCCSSCV